MESNADEGESSSHLCFAYGSNLDSGQMLERCPDASSVEVGFLEGFTLSFTRHSKKWNGGVADVIESPGKRVWGLVWRLSSEDLKSLDRHEGHPKSYCRREMEILLRSEKKVSAWVYEVVEKKALILPSDRYLSTISSSAKALGLPEDYVEFVASFGRAPKSR